jgi:hypothetical protein
MGHSIRRGDFTRIGGRDNPPLRTLVLMPGLMAMNPLQEIRGATFYFDCREFIAQEIIRLHGVSGRGITLCANARAFLHSPARVLSGLCQCVSEG